MWIKNDSIIAKDKPFSLGGGSVKGSDIKASSVLEGSKAGKPIKSNKESIPSVARGAESVKSDASLSGGAGNKGTSTSTPPPSSSVSGDVPDNDSSERSSSSRDDARSSSGASVNVGDSDAERLARLQSQKAIANEEAGIAKALLDTKAAVKKGEQLDKVGKRDATDVAQNLGSSGVNLGIGVSTLLLAALIPPIGIPLTIAAAGFLAKGSFQGLNGILGAAEVVGDAVGGAAKTAGKTTQAIGNAAAATGQAISRSATETGRGAANAARAAGRAATSTKDAAGNLYNKATGRNAPDDRAIKEILNRKDDDKTPGALEARKYLKSSQELGKSKELKKLSNLLTGNGTFFKSNPIPEDLTADLSEQLRSTLEQNPQGGLEQFAENVTQYSKNPQNNKRTNNYYKKVADAATALKDSPEYENYNTNKQAFDEKGTPEDKETIQKYQEAAQQYGKKIAIKYRDQLSVGRGFGEPEDEHSIVVEGSNTSQKAAEVSSAESRRGGSETKEDTRTVNSQDGSRAESLNDIEIDPKKLSFKDDVSSLGGKSNLDNKDDNASRASEKSERSNKSGGEIVRDPAEFEKAYRKSPQEFQTFIEQDPFNAANIISQTNLNENDIRDSGVSPDGFQRFQSARGLKEEARKGNIEAAEAFGRGLASEEKQTDSVKAAKEANQEQSLPLGLSAKSKNTAGEPEIEFANKPQYEYVADKYMYREGNGKPSEAASSVQPQASRSASKVKEASKDAKEGASKNSPVVVETVSKSSSGRSIV